MPEPATHPEDLPEVHVSLVLVRTGATSLIRALGRKRGQRFLIEWMQLLATEDAVSAILPIRPDKDRPAQVEARKQAVAWVRQVMPTLIASLPPE